MSKSIAEQFAERLRATIPGTAERERVVTEVMEASARGPKGPDVFTYLVNRDFSATGVSATGKTD